jgi:hypothetical protein
MAADIRKVGRRLLLLADAGAGLVAAGVVVTGFLWPDLFGVHDPETGELTFRLGAGARGLFWAAFVLLLWNALYWLYGRPPRAPLTHVASEGPGGPVRIAREAIESGLHRAGEAVPGVSRLRIGLVPGGLKRVRIRAVFQAPDGVDLARVTRELREAIERRFAALVRLGDGWRADLEIEFAGFAGKLIRKAGAPAEPDAEAEPPFTGPKYPIDDDDPYQMRRGS